MDPILILIFIILLCLSAFFSWSETALISITPHKINSLVKEKRFWAIALKTIRSNTDRLLITILIWNNLVNTLTASLATSIAIWIAKDSWLWITEATAIWITTWLVTFALLIFWEILPKSIGSKSATKIWLFVAPIFNFLMKIFFPIVWIFEKIIKLFSKDIPEEEITEEEIWSFIDMWKERWWLDEDEHEKIKSILEFDDITVEEIMTPRVKIDAISVDLTVEKAITYYLTHTHTRIPVYKWTIDNIDYFISWRDLLREIRLWNLDKKVWEIKLRRVLKVPLNQSISVLLEDLQKAHKTMSIIVDEYGWVAWLVTIEDIIEEVFWDIRDETDEEIEEFIKVWDNSVVAESYVLIEDILDEFSLELENIWLDEKEFGWETLSYIITHVLDRFPSPWEVINFDIEWDWKSWILMLKISDINNAKIWKVEMKVIPSGLWQ